MKNNKKAVSAVIGCRRKIFSSKPQRHAVSAVIGVILMVAITVAIAITVYVYVDSLTSDLNEQEGIHKGYLIEYNYKGDDDYFLKLNTTEGFVFLNVTIESNTFFEINHYYQIDVNKYNKAEVVELQ